VTRFPAVEQRAYSAPGWSERAGHSPSNRLNQAHSQGEKNIMRAFVRTSLLSLVLVGVGSISGAQMADGQPAHAYTLGTVWSVSYIQTKPGKFEDYMNYVADTWVKIQESEKKAGRVVSYKILSVSSTRDNEPDIILMVEQPNWATNDTPQDVADAATAEAFGSLQKSNEAAIDRESLRTLRGGFQAQQLVVTPK
jgi:hypothetical protein